MAAGKLPGRRDRRRQAFRRTGGSNLLLRRSHHTRPPGSNVRKGSTQYPRWRKQVRKTVDIVLGTSSAVAELVSRYALDRFEDFAAQLEKDEFVGWASFIYGTDVPLEAYRKLREDLADKSLWRPRSSSSPEASTVRTAPTITPPRYRRQRRHRCESAD